MSRNLTVQLDEEVIRQAKVLAAQRGTSVSALVAQQIAALTAANERYERAQKSALRMMAETREQSARLHADESVDQGGQGWSRDDLYQERLGRFAR